jgi:hypothetical protein
MQTELLAELRVEDSTPTAVVLREATAAYEAATAEWFAQRAAGGIVKADAYERERGVKYKAETVDGGRALMAWQRARAELSAAAENRRRVLGDRKCRSCATGVRS